MTKIQNVKQSVKTHVVKHKAVYITGGVCLMVGALGGGLYAARRPEILAKNQNNALVIWKPQQTVLQFVERSTPSKPVHLVGTQQYFDSINQAAKQTGHSASMISRNIGGKVADVKGDVFELVDTAA